MIVCIMCSLSLSPSPCIMWGCVHRPQQATPTIAMAAPAPVPVLPTPTLFQCTAFETLGLKQPFSVNISSNVLMIMVSNLKSLEASLIIILCIMGESL